MRLGATPPIRASAVQEDLDLVVLRELPSQIFVEVIPVPRRHYEVSNHRRLPPPDLAHLVSSDSKGMA
jgi:hypothetical protein